ncbi:MAG: N-acetylmuramoyl-L-alanine amidase [Psychrobacillus sp.]
MANAKDFKIVLDDGHGDNGVTPGKRTPKFEDGTFMYENTFNKTVVKYLNEELKRCGFNTILSAPTDADTPLATRVKVANNAKADLFISVHANANTGKWGTWGGTETYVYPTGESKRIGTIIHKNLMEGTPLRDRGVKDGSGLYVISNTSMPAILVECAFMDNKEEAKLLLSDSFRRECAKEIAKGICEGLKVSYVEEKKETAKPKDDSTKELYRVRKSWADAKSQKGAFSNLDNAKDLANKEGLNVYDSKGKEVYKGKKEEVKKESSKPKVQPKPKYEIPTATLKVGSKGKQVELLQKALNGAKFKLKGKVDGVFGPDTLQALKRFQSVYTPYEIDGIAGKNTYSALNKVLNK